jgi:hypothetical protein
MNDVVTPATPETQAPTEDVSAEALKQMREGIQEFKNMVMYFFQKVPLQFSYISISSEPLEDPKNPNCKAAAKLCMHVDLPTVDASQLPRFVYKSQHMMEFGSTPISGKMLSGMVFHRNGTIYVGDPAKTQNQILERIVDHLSDPDRAKHDVCARLPFWNGMDNPNSLTNELVSELDKARCEASLDIIRKLFKQYSGWKTVTVSRVAMIHGPDQEVLNPHAGVIIVHKGADPKPMTVEHGELYLADAPDTKVVGKAYLPTGRNFTPMVFHRRDFI